MSDRDTFKYRLVSQRRPPKRRRRPTRDIADRYRIDLVDLHRKIAREERRRGQARSRWVKVMLSLVIAPAFFLLGYLIAGLPTPLWVRTLLVIFVAVLGLLPGYVAAVI